MKTWKVKMHIISTELFQFSLITYFLLLLAEILKPGFVSFFFELNIFLAVAFVSGAIMVLTDNFHKPAEVHKKFKKLNVIYILLLTIGGSLLVLYKMQNAGLIGIVLSALAAVLVLLFSILLFTDR
jgi:Na+/citrate or Na+/malate symporter